jgi:hypothetical protein
MEKSIFPLVNISKSAMSLRKFIGYVSPTLKDPQKCEACKELFTCGASIFGCWCTKIKLSKETLKELQSSYKSCLCQNCLTKLSIKNPA